MVKKYASTNKVKGEREKLFRPRRKVSQTAIFFLKWPPILTYRQLQSRNAGLHGQRKESGKKTFHS